MLLLALYSILVVVDPSLPSKTIIFMRPHTLSIIVAMLLASRGVELSGLLSRASITLVTATKDSAKKLAPLLVMASGLTAALVMNDAALFIFLPLVASVEKAWKTKLTELYVLVTLAANIVSALTPIGNPQNLYIWQHYKLSFTSFIAGMAPFTIISLTVLLAYSWLVAPKTYRGKTLYPPPIKMDLKLALASIIVLIAVIVLGEVGYQLGSLIAAALLILVRREILVGLDLPLIAVFALMFIDFHEVSELLSPLILLQHSELEAFLETIALSQVISNVPATVLLSNSISDWRVLAMGANLGGAGLPTGSLANIILLRIARLRIRSYLKYSLPFFTILVAVFSVFFAIGLYL